MKSLRIPQPRSLPSILFASLMASACAAPMGQDASNASEPVAGGSPARDDVAAVPQAIYGGPVVAHRGVVRLGVGCTGALISERYAVTAAHCFRRRLNGAKEDDLKFNVVYFDPDNVSAGNPDGSREISSSDTEHHVWVAPGYEPGDPEADVLGNDVALIKAPTRWPGTDYRDYLALGRLSCSQLDRNTLYGSGVSNPAGGGSGTLRSLPRNVTSCSAAHFRDRAGPDSTDPRVCKGDSGGPNIVELANGDSLIAGLHSGGKKNAASGRCTKNNGKQNSVRMTTSHVDWIKTKVTSGSACFDTAYSGYPYTICI